ncbi:MAG: class I SAM-dependent methyltransferase [Sneathiellaceae bacterium]
MTAMPSVGPEPFERLYRRHADPWGYLSSPYERAKYRHTLQVLPRPRYRAGLEVGCSIGVLGGLLAGRCRDLLGIDFSAVALAQARRRHAGRDGLRFQQCRVPGDFPAGRFDLIVLSEILYFLDRQDLRRLATKVGTALLPGGDLVLVSWLGATDTPLNGDAATDCFLRAAAPPFTVKRRARRKGYRLDLLTRR